MIIMIMKHKRKAYILMIANHFMLYNTLNQCDTNSFNLKKVEKTDQSVTVLRHNDFYPFSVYHANVETLNIIFFW